MMEFTRQIPLSDPTYRHLQGCRDEMTDVFLRKFSCEVELRGPKGGSYSAPSITPDEKVYEKRMSGGPVISVWRGDLTKQDADVVVNAANEDLDQAGGLARALAEAGGPIVVKDSKDYIRHNGPLKTSEYAVTRAGDLPCKCLLHAVGPVWCDDTAARCEAELAKCIENVLTYATKNKAVQSVAIPAISSGIFGFPLQKCAEIIARSVRTFFIYSVTHLQEIRLMNNDEPTVQAMKRACESMFGHSDALRGATAASGSQTGPVTRSMAAALQPSSSAASNKNVYGQPSAQRTPQPVTINGLTLHLVQGFIQEQNTAVIVNSLGTDLDMRVGRVSNAILQKAGDELQHDVNRARYVYPLPLVIPSSAYRLPCAAVYHVILQAGYSRSLLEALPFATFECLKIAQMHNVPSISFPALGTGNFGLSKPNAAQAMLDSVTTFARGNRVVMNVFIVIHPQDSETYKAFEDQWNVRGWNQNPTSEAEERDPRPEVRGESSDTEIQCLVIRGTREEHVEEAKVWMTNVLRPQPVSIQNNLILLFGKEEHDVLTSAEAALVEERLSDGTSLVTIDGPPQDKVRAVMEVERLLCDVQEKHGVTLEEELLEAAVMWFYENKGGAWRYSAKANRELERAYVSQQDVTLQSDPHHVISMKTLTAQGDGGAFQLQRRTIDDSSMNGQMRRRPEDYISRVILVDPKSLEFKDQENHFKTQNLTLVKMEKIHNSYLTQIFQSKKGAKPKKTCRVYQLVPRAFTELVCHVGFQRVFSNPKDARFGQGIYFADSPRRALECFQTLEEEGGLHHIFQAEVVSDSSAVIRDAPALVPKKSSRASNSEDILDLCDSLVDTTISPYIFVIPDSFQANPLYLFTLRRQELNLVWK